MKKVLIGVAALLAVLVVVAFALPFIVPTGPVRDRIVAEVTAATGRDLRIDGPVRLSVFPSVAVTVGDVTLANAPGTSRPQMVQLGRLDVSVSLLPLLSGEIEVKRLILREPSIWLEVDENGTPNWVFDTAAPPAAAEPAPDAPTQGGFSIGALRLGEVAIVDGRIGYLDVRSGQAYAIDDLDVEIALPSLDDPLAIDGDLVFQERALAFQLGVDTPRPLVEGGESDVRLSLAGNPLDFTFDGRLSTAGPPETSGRLSLTVPSLASVGDWLGLALPKEGLPVDRVALTGTLAGTPARIAFEEAALKVDDIEATGDLAVALDGPRPAIGGRLAVGLLDLDALLPP
ncbi:MAG: AsmA family protein, partial [Inquilinus sp.]|nr:AsmA family protein [Inquilinus sp.]